MSFLLGRRVCCRVASLALAAAFFSPCQSLSQTPSPEGSDRSTAVRTGDRIELSIFTAAGERLGEVSGPRTVDQNGRIFLPYVGSLEVEGLDALEIRELLTQRYASFYSNPVVDVETRIRVNVTGAVRQPGNYFLPPTSTLIDVLATAGGTQAEVDFTGWGAAADLGRVRLVREGGTRVLDLRPVSPDAAVLNLPIQSGDWLHIPPQTQSRWRSNLQLLGSFFSVVGSIAAVVVLVGG